MDVTNLPLQDNFDPNLWDYALHLGLAVVVVAVAVRLFFWRRSDFCIVVKQGAVTYRGRIPLALRPACSEFLLNDLALQGPARVYAIKQKSGWRIWFRGRIGDGEKQRIRNFIVTRLGSR
jgi:hypothetical protein